MSEMFFKYAPIERQRKYYRRIKEMPSTQRLEYGFVLSKVHRELRFHKIQKRHPHYTKEQVFREYCKQVLTPEEFCAHFGDGAGDKT